MPGGMFLLGGGGVSAKGVGTESPLVRTSGSGHSSGRYASHWNAFMF